MKTTIKPCRIKTKKGAIIMGFDYGEELEDESYLDEYEEKVGKK